MECCCNNPRCPYCHPNREPGFVPRCPWAQRVPVPEPKSPPKSPPASVIVVSDSESSSDRGVGVGMEGRRDGREWFWRYFKSAGPKDVSKIILVSRLSTASGGANAKFYTKYGMDIRLGVYAKVKVQLKEDEEE